MRFFHLALLPLAAAKFAVTPIGEMRKAMAADAKLEAEHETKLASRDINPEKLYPTYTFAVPVDHFHNESIYEPHSSDKFNLRYWFDASHYKPGGPVFILESGETNGLNRLVYLQKGLLAQMAEENNGIGVVIEHRYYGRSFPVPSLSVEHLRFHTTDQAMVDVVYFAENIKFPGLEHLDLTAGKVPWIAYGGSYAGAFVAFLRTQYPGTFHGAISSSGVTEAIFDYWQYYEPIRKYGPKKCIQTTQALTHAMDNIILKYRGTPMVEKLKTLFGMQTIKSYRDFMNALSFGVGGWQSLNWDPAVTYNGFYDYCNDVSSDSIVYPKTKKLKSEVQMFLTKGGYGDQLSTYTNPMLNWIGWAEKNLINTCASTDLDECYTTQNQTFYDQMKLHDSVWRSWPWQYCTHWGFLQTGSGVPATQLPLISRTITLEYTTTICRDAFQVKNPSNTKSINSRGGFYINYPRLAIIGGEWDPWRPSTPLAASARPWPKSSTDKPFYLIPKAVHHWDENGLFPNQTTPSLPPTTIVEVQAFENTFVKAWLKEFKAR